MAKIAIIAALPREIAGLTRGWSASKKQIQNREVHIFESNRAIISCGGIGMICARIATEAAWQKSGGKIAQIISAGFAGALIPELKVGEIFEPEEVVESVDNQRIKTVSGNGVLVTAGAIAGGEYKQSLARAFTARAVDMEAFAVGDVARIYGVPFRAIKAISDELDFPMPSLGQFVDERGQFHTSRMILYAAVRPATWPVLIALGSNSARAAETLAETLRNAINQ